MTGVATPPATLAGSSLADGWDRLRERGLLAEGAFADRRDELTAVRRVASTSLALGRVFDGHRNAIERLTVTWAGLLPPAEREAIAAGALALGVWGADPGPGEGDPAQLVDRPGGPVLRGVKTFCSGAGLLDRAIVLVRRAPDAPPTVPVLVDLRTPSTLQIDRTWFVADALRESRSDRVVFDETPVIAVLGAEGALSQEPWFSGDALRSTAVWVGGADTIVRRLAATASQKRPSPADLERLGRASATLGSLDAWLDVGLRAVEGAHAGGAEAQPTVDALRLECSDRVRALLLLAAEITGSRGLVSDRDLIDARAGLDLLLLQHRLGGAAARLGRALTDAPDAP